MSKSLRYLRIFGAVAGILLLSAAGCGAKSVQIGRTAITTQINSDNTPVGTSQLNVVSSAPAIYFCGEVLSAKEGDAIDIVWRYLTEDQLLATESFRGARDDSRPQEFITGVAPADSWFSSRLTLTRLSWGLGSYEIAISLNGKEVKKVDFNVVSSKEIDEIGKKALLENLYLGSKLDAQNRIAIPGASFKQSEPNIYGVALMKDAPNATKVRAVWKHLESNRVINDFSTSFSGSGYLPFAISLEQFGRLWPDRLWPAGTYSLTLYVDNVLVTTRNFAVS